MSMPTHVGDRTYQKFIQTFDGKTAVRTIDISGWAFINTGYEIDIVSSASNMNDVYYLKSNITQVIVQLTYTNSSKTNVVNVLNTYTLYGG